MSDAGPMSEVDDPILAKSISEAENPKVCANYSTQELYLQLSHAP